MSKIKKHISDALVERGVAPAIAEHLSANADCLGMFADESSELDSADIERVAEGLASIIHRHSVTPDLIAPIEEISPREDDEAQFNDDTPFIRRLRAMSPGAGKFLSYTAAALLSVLIAAVTAAAVAVTAALIIVMIALTVSGILLFIIGLIYGVSQLEEFPAAALYEIGSGLVLGGAAALLTVLLYALVMGAIPSLTRKIRRCISCTLTHLRHFRHSLS